MLCWAIVVSSVLATAPHRHFTILVSAAGGRVFMCGFMSGVHIEEEEEGEVVDYSVRGRLLRLLERVKKIRQKKVEEEPEPEEDKKPSEPPQMFHT